MTARDLYYDNLKGLLMILVVVCHFLTCFLLKSDVLLRAFVLFVFGFHMPLFIFVSGYFSKNADKCRETAFSNLFLVFLVAQVFWVIFKYFANGSVFYLHHFLDPGYAIWYIVALFFWRLFLKDIVKLRFALALAFLISPLIMLFDGAEATLAINKTVGFLFFFLLGYYTSEETVAKIRRIPTYLALLLLVSAFAVTVWLLKENLIVYAKIKGVFMHIRTFSEFSSIWQGFAAYYGAILLAVVLGALFLAAVPGKKTVFAAVGNDTLPLYLSHTYFLILCPLLLTKLPLSHAAEGALTMAVCVAVLILFSTNVYRRFFHRVYNFLIRLIYPCT